MDPILLDWLSLLLRWTHVMLGIGWIGTSFYFVWLDSSLRPPAQAPQGVGGESWMVHGGGFYHAQKYFVAPATLPKELHWFKYEAYFTWVSGFLLLAVVYYVGASAFLIDSTILRLEPAEAIAISVGGLALGWIVYDLLCRSPLGRRTGPLAAAVLVLAVGAAYGFAHVFSGRAAFVHVGAFLGTIMSANVFFIIIPNQKKVVADLIAGRKPDPRLGETAKQRSLHNNYLTLPVVLMMISNHYPILYSSGHGWFFVAGFLLLGGLVRLYANRKSAGQTETQVAWLLATAAGVGIILVIANVGLLSPSGGSAPAGSPVALAEVEPIIQQRCVTCHSARPTDADFSQPPKGIAFDSPDDIKRFASLILKVAVQTSVMPIGNRTKMTQQERDVLGRWIRGGAKD